MSTQNGGQVTAAQDFKDEGSALHGTALFNPHKQTRKRALQQLRANSTLTGDEWQELDKQVFGGANQAKQEAVAKLREAGLTADSTLEIDEWMDVLDGDVLEEHDAPATFVSTLMGDGYGRNASLNRYVYIYQLRNTGGEAEVSMNGRAQSTNDSPAYGFSGVPLPIVHSDYEIEARELQNSRAFGESLDDVGAEVAYEEVRHKVEELAFEGWDATIHTERGNFELTGINDRAAPEVMDLSAAGGFQDPQNVLDTIDKGYSNLEQQGDDENEGPVPSEAGIYGVVPTAQWGEITRGVYQSSATDEPLIDRIERKYPALDLIHAPRLQAGRFALVTQDTRYFDIAGAQSPTNMSWEADGGMAIKNKVLASRVPVVKEQPDDVQGIVNFEGA